ncbi:tyrosine-type recombinase/integrase [Vagococcus carniphilus]|uniref:Site-specific integrase n=1 Tax=Vagococcus carniphilus TaxID=218144 RepID=A0A430ARX1_9ENTE|nr:tyrosine-type recombinase/integrase [Vagococcus carniphilus]MDT2813283.1 tyrosine-type recombinase/integrase [Vagococcus carniphilus]QNN73255.1 tyrosine-type recombinase/integrase [Vagococcus carniphilus]RSU10808.1 site-specific integrase [Vagococcus carniphilus]
MTRKIINVKPIKEKQILKTFTEELRQTKHPERDYLIFCIGIFTGLRISDILNLKVSDVQNRVETNIIEIKTNKKRTLNLMQLTNQIIIYLKQEHDGESEWLFPSPRDNTKPLATHQYYKIMQKVAKDLELDYIGTHTMRKTFGYAYYQKTKDLPTLMTILNHSSQAITLRYIGIEDEQIKESLDDFNPLN